jgi:integrase
MRAHGEGTIRQRPSGLWHADFMHRGRRRSVYGRTKAEATAKLRNALLEAEIGLPAPSTRLTTGLWLDRWLTEYVEPRLRPRTAESYRYVVRMHLMPAIGRVPLARLSPDDVAGMLARLEGRVSGTTRRYVYSILRIALGRAMKVGLVTRNLATLVDPPRKDRREIRPLTSEQVSVFLEATAGDRLHALYVVALGLGLRQGEALALRWSDIDLDRAIVRVRHTLRRGDRVIAQPKTERSRRTLLMPEAVVAALREQRRLTATIDPEAFVFATPEGRPLDGVNVTHEFQAALARVGLPRQRFHDLRHAHATLLIEGGVELAVVSRALGHSDLSTTADVYGAWTRDMAGRVASRMDDVLRKKATG